MSLCCYLNSILNYISLLLDEDCYYYIQQKIYSTLIQRDIMYIMNSGESIKPINLNLHRLININLDNSDYHRNSFWLLFD